MFTVADDPVPETETVGVARVGVVYATVYSGPVQVEVWPAGAVPTQVTKM
jgi:hypothetical protein